MRLAKEEELKREIEIIAQSHERGILVIIRVVKVVLTTATEVDRKDAIIVHLVNDINDVEVQFQTAIRAHAQHLDRFLVLHRDRLTRLESEYQRAQVRRKELRMNL